MYCLLLWVSLATVVAFDPTTMPGFNYDKWWGPEGVEEDTSIIPVKIEWREEEIADLLYRLNHRRDFVPSMDGALYNYGVNTNTIGYWLDYWANDYNFTERLEYINQYPHYKTMIQGLYIHFIRIVPEVPEGKCVIPCMMVHGFPGSILEFYKTVKYITEANDNSTCALELVIPSLPGFGYSDYTNYIGLGAAEMAYLFKLLMQRLGHEKFMYQGGDWGSIIGQIMATLYPEVLIGYHSNMGFALTDDAYSMISIGSLYPAALMPTDLISRLYPLSDTISHAIQQTGYFHMQATQPDTVGIGMSDSPSGLLAWIFQQISTCTRKANINDTRGGLDRYPIDELIDDVMMYWIPNKMPTACRIYAETGNKRTLEMGHFEVPTPVPTIVVQAKDELYYMPPAVLNTKFTNLVAVDVLDDYGHFLAWEAPELFAELFLSGIERILKYREENGI